MGTTKTSNYSDEKLMLSELFKVFGHPARLSILEAIAKEPSCICGDIVLEVGLAQSTVSQHLNELKKVGIIKGSIEGASVCYCIDEQKWTEVQKVISQFMNQDFNKITCC